MTQRITLFRWTALLGTMGVLGFAAVTQAATRVCPPAAGVFWGDGDNTANLNSPEDCWLGQTFATATENVGRGNILVGPTGGNDRIVWAYNFNSGPQHDFIRVKGFDLFDNPTCTAVDTTKNAQPTQVGGQACFGTLYALVEGYRN